MNEGKYEFGMIGLGTMGRNLVLNMTDHGYSVAGFDKDQTKVAALEKESNGHAVHGFLKTGDFVNALKTPRTIMLLVPAGKVVDSVIDELKPLLSKGDLIMDCGNSHFTDTDRRTKLMEADGFMFMGVGVSGGEKGARYGPSIMPGGTPEAYDRISAMLQAIAAQVGPEPCVTYLGPRSAGHYVKMIHNGIEYAIMELIAETYHILKTGGGFSNDQLHDVFSKWNEGDLQSFLVEITAAIFPKVDDKTGKRLIDMILDKAYQKGTGMWTSQDAMELQVPVPNIDVAVMQRNLSTLKEVRVSISERYSGPIPDYSMDQDELAALMEQSLYFATIITFIQGMAQLAVASEEYAFNLNLADIAKIWRGGCIIRARLLSRISEAYAAGTNIPNLLLNPEFADMLMERQGAIRTIIAKSTEAGIPVPGFMSALAYFDSFRQSWLPANLIEAQRDYFGAHTHEWTDHRGVSHTKWND